MKPIAVVSILILTILAPIWENGSAATVQTSENRFAPLRSADAKRFDPNRLQLPNKKTVQNVPSQMPSNKMGQRQSPPALPISNMDSMRKSLEGNAVTLVPPEQSSQPKKKSKLNKRRRKQLKEKKQAEQNLADIASDGQDLLDVPNHLEPIQEANFLEEAESTQDSESFKDAPAVRESDSLKSVESAQESEFFETAESAQQAESFVQAESVKELEFLEAVLSSLETEFLQEAKSDRESKSQENAQALQESESVKAVESALESGSFETVESAQEPESFEIVKSVQDSESVKAVESAQETESCVTAEIAKRAESLEAVESALEADVLEEAEFLQDAPAAQESESLIAVESALEAGSMKATESALEVESKHASSVHEARFETDEYVGVDTTEFSHAAASLEAAEAVSSRKASDHGTLQQGVDIESPNSSSTPTLSLDNETSTLPASSPQRLYPVNNFNYLEESLSPNKGDREFDSTKASIGSDQRDIETPIADNGSISLDSLYYENTRRRNRKGNRIHKRLSVKQPTLRLWPKSRAGAARNQRMLLENQEQLIRLLFFNLYYYAKSVDPSSVQSSSNLPDSYHSHPSDTTVADSGSVEPLSSSPKKRSFDDREDLEQPASKRFRVHLGTPSADQHMLQHDQYELEVMNLSTLPDQENFHNLNVYPDELAKYTYYDSDVQNPNSRKTPKALETSDVDFATDSSSTIFEPIIMDGSRKSFIDEMSTAKYTNPAITSVEEQKTPDKASDANSLSDNLRESEITANSYSLPLSNPDLTQPETVQYQQNFFQFIWSRWWFKLIVLTAICTIIVALTTFFVRRHIIRRRRLSAFDNNIVFVDPHKTGSINMDSDQEDNFFSTASHMLRRGGIQINY